MQDATAITVLAIHQRSAPLAARERIAIRLASVPPRSDVVALSSCHRVELYFAPGEPAAERAASIFGPELARDLAGAQWYDGEEAVRHLFRVTAGLDSVVVGEGQIAGQVKRIHARALECGVDPALERALRRSLSVARDLRALIGSHGRSVGSLAVDDALSSFVDPKSARALVIGAGEMGKLSARALSRRVGELVIANRDVERARVLAAGIGARAVGLEAVPTELARADTVISAADTRGELLTRVLLGPRCSERPLVLVDIAVPRSVADDARDLPGLRYRDVDDLGSERAPLSPELVALAEQRCAEEARAFMADVRSRAAASTIRALRERADQLRSRQLDRALRKLAHLPDRDRRVVEGLASALVGAIVHRPVVTLRGSPDHAEAARALFDLGPDEGRS